MAWNEPGGDKDPWKGKNNDGPPDLDEVIKKLQQGFAGLFGGGGGKPTTGNGQDSGDNDGTPAGPSWVIIGVVIGILASLWMASGFYTIAPAERGVVLRFGAYQRITQPGLNWHIPVPIESLMKVNVDQISSFLHKATMLTKDENIVDVELTVQSRILDAEDYLFQDQSPERTMRDTTEAVVREVIGKSNLDFVLTEGRAAIAADIKQKVQKLMTAYQTGLEITSINMQPAKPPEAVKSAFDDAIKAREDKERLENQAEAYRNAVVPQARGEGARITADAEAYKGKVIAVAEGESERFIAVLNEYQKAPQVTRERLYIETIEEVLANTSKVIMDVEGGNSLMYLPLDKLMDRPRISRNPSRMVELLPDRIMREREASDANKLRQSQRSRGIR